MKTNFLSANLDSELNLPAKTGYNTLSKKLDFDDSDNDFAPGNSAAKTPVSRPQITNAASANPDFEDDINDGEQSVDLAKEIAMVKEENEKRLKAKIESLEQQLEKTEHALHSLELQHSSLQADHESVLQDLNLKNKIIEEFDKKGRSLSDESQKFLSQIKQLNEKNARLQKKVLELQETSQEDKKTQLAREREAETQRKEIIKLESELTSKSKKIEQLLEDVAKMKTAYRSKVGSAKETGGLENEQKNNEKLQNEIKKLEKQKANLLTVIKKQVQLADVLKRQRANVQSAFL